MHKRCLARFRASWQSRQSRGRFFCSHGDGSFDLSALLPQESGTEQFFRSYMWIPVSGRALLVHVMNRPCKAVLNAGSAAYAIAPKFRFSCVQTDIPPGADIFAGTATRAGTGNNELISDPHPCFKLVVFHMASCQQLFEG